MKRFSYLLRLVLSISFVTATLFPEACPAQTQQKPVARAVSVQGSVEVQRAGAGVWQPVKLNDTFAPGDRIRVQKRSRADLAMLDQSTLRLNADTEITVEALKDERTGVVDLLRGAAHFFSRGPGSLEVRTLFTIAGVRGTEFFVSVEPDRALLTIFEGTVLAENPSGNLTLTSGQSAVAEADKSPELRVVARPRDAVHWALYYPPVLYLRPDEFPAGPDWPGMVRESLNHYLSGDLQKAFESIATVAQTVSDPRFFAYRAHLLLAVGRVDEAAAEIGQALQLAPDDADALALETVVAVVQGETDRAFDVAQKAVQSAPGSATARIALSYAQQARFDLESARASLQKAVELEPQNALAWARLSELWASFGELDRAFEAAQKATALEPNLSRTQTVLGFANLMQVKTKQAREAFEKAIVLDSADPLARLGLGLAKIREGNLHEGSREIEAAASLDSGNAIIRSYLGKAYYEEKRIGLDEREYAVAKQLDPKDPTPLFYDAIAKQTTNRPAEALQEMEQAIELNDNRAVYRSRLLLDEDLAARSAAQARIHTDLGFQQLALVEGWKSVNIDPTNFSAHRFLADSYAARPRHEIARVSELLQSQLLQPLNMTPIQPRLAESNLLLLSGLGPAALSFNEFNPIFNRDGTTLQTSGLVGDNNTWAAEGVLAGIYKKASFSIGYSHFDTDGWRTNADQKDDIGNAFVQLELSPQTSIQAEYRFRQTDVGDIHQRFFPEDFFPGQRNEQESQFVRVGGRNAFSPSSILLGSLMYQDSEDNSIDDTFPFEFRGSESAVGGELQHLFRSQSFNLTSGAGYFGLNGDIKATFGGPPTIEIPTDLSHVNAYAYGYINLLKNATFTVGSSVDSTNGDQPGEGEVLFNPKFGITWEPIPGTTLRAAAFQVLKRTLITNQTLEPTQVAGFNQFFDDVNLTEAVTYGGAVDQKFTKNIFGGAEYFDRDLKVPFLDFTDPAFPNGKNADADWNERLGRAYLFWTPHAWLALRLEYLYERSARPDELPEGATRVETHRVPLGFNFFHPSGLSASVTTTYWNQSGTFQSPLTGENRPGRDEFWLTDAAISYRLPKRSGFIAVGARNLFDQDFNFFDDSDNPVIQPGRALFARVTLALP